MTRGHISKVYHRKLRRLKSVKIAAIHSNCTTLTLTLNPKTKNNPNANPRLDFLVGSTLPIMRPGVHFYHTSADQVTVTRKRINTGDKYYRRRAITLDCLTPMMLVMVSVMCVLTQKCHSRVRKRPSRGLTLINETLHIVKN